MTRDVLYRLQVALGHGIFARPNSVRQDICVEERVDLISLLSGCADEVEELTEVPSL
eukprot:Skav213369  [mRNA]  locus=scaffold797:30233:35819:+ [translate_table: standard]